MRGNALRGMCKHRLAVHLLRQTQDHFDPDKAASPDPKPGDPEPVPSVETGTGQGQRPISPYTCPEPKYWVKGGRRTVNKAEKEIIENLHQAAEAKCKAAFDVLPPDVWGYLVLLSRSQKLPGKDDVFVSLRNPYLTVAGRLVLLRAKWQPKEIATEFLQLGERTLCRATVKVGQCSAMGTAEVIEGQSGPTATNPYEVRKRRPWVGRSATWASAWWAALPPPRRS